MSQFPINSPEGVYEAVNYLASGPAASGQIFNGFNAFKPLDPADDQYLTGNFRLPFSQVGTASLYVPPISLSNAEQLDNRTIKYTFSSPQASPPFSLGNGITIENVTPSTYDSSSLSAAGYSAYQIGVVQCTTTYVIVRTRSPINTDLGTYVSGGTVKYYIAADVDNSAYTSTDCDIRINVNGNTDKVAVNGQLNQTISYDVISGPSDFTVWVAINRYRGFPNNDPVNPDYLFDKEATIAREIYYYTGLTGTGTIDTSTVFQTVLDTPGLGYYRYILEVVFEYPTGGVEVQVSTDLLGLRSISAQTGK